MCNFAPILRFTSATVLRDHPVFQQECLGQDLGPRESTQAWGGPLMDWPSRSGDLWMPGSHKPFTPPADTPAGSMTTDMSAVPHQTEYTGTISAAELRHPLSPKARKLLERAQD